MQIRLKKNIPIAAGLAGGSTDAAAALHGINQWLKLGLSLHELQEIGTAIGSDIPFCLQGGFCRVRGRGEQIESIPAGQEIWMLIITPPLVVSTALIYRTFDCLPKAVHYSFCNEVAESLQKGSNQRIPWVWGNDLERATFSLFPAVEKLKKNLAELPYILGALMSGSGPTIICLVAGEKEGIYAEQKLRSLYPDYAIHLAKTIRPEFKLEFMEA